jgi:hypothetical protein
MIKDVLILLADITKAVLEDNYNEDLDLPTLYDGRTGLDIIKRRVRRRFNEKCKEVGVDPKVYKSYDFTKIFDLPTWLTFNKWLLIQLRGRDINDLFVLNLDHIVPISIAENFEELIILFSWRNTRLADPGMNEEKSSHLDAENILLCERLLGRKPPANWDGTTGKTIEQAPNNTDRLAKLFKAKGNKSRNSKLPAEKPSFGKNRKKKR